MTNESGSWNWIGNPQAILINGQGYYGDCQLFAPAGASTAPPTCAPSVFTVAAGRSVQQPWASNNNPGTCGSGPGALTEVAKAVGHCEGHDDMEGHADFSCARGWASSY